MIKRPLHMQFGDAVLAGRKITTIRCKPWPVGVPIMLYHWAGAAYRSKQINLAAVEVLETMPIEISNPEFGTIHFNIRWVGKPSWLYGRPLWSCEGFANREAMEAWFCREVPHGDTEIRHLMHFRLLNRVESTA